MAHKQTTHKPKRHGWLQSIRHWLNQPKAGALPPIFDNAVPPDLEVFEAQVEEARHQVQEVPAPPSVHDGRSKPARRK